MLIYRLFLTLLAPALLLVVVLRVLRGREGWSDMAERLGGGAPPGVKGPVWLHGASVGELTSARPLIDALRAARPDLPLLITCNTTTARDRLRGWALPNTVVQLAPLDLAWITRRLTRRHRLILTVFLENELWPNRVATSRAPVALVAARVSGRAAKGWGRAAWLARAVLSRVALASPQDAASETRLVQLGLPEAALGARVNLKAAVDTEGPDPQALADLRPHFPRDATLLAASTHLGEEEAVLQAFLQIRATRPEARLILAPRHPDRGSEVAAIVRFTGLLLARRSKGEPPDAPVYLADTLGEMPLWYALAGATFVAGSWAEKGGHTPFEPAAAQSAIFHGPHVSNFAEAYAALAAAGGAIETPDAAALADAVLALGPDDAARQTQAATHALASLGNSDQIEALAQALLALAVTP